MNFRKKTVVFLSTGFYIGKIPQAPGTFGSLIGLPICFLISGFNVLPALATIVGFIILAILIAHEAEQVLQQKDPGCIVIDEIAGMIVTLAVLPFTPLTAITGFILFRILDILKPFPIRDIEKKIPGGLGIVIDDVVAGIIANVTLRIFLQLIEKISN